MEPLVGQYVAEGICLKGRLATGGMSTIWIADDTRARHEVAVKFLSAELCEYADAIERFEDEARVMARIRSPYVPRVFGSGTAADGTPFMVMELLSGIDLDSQLEAKGPLSLAMTGRLVSHIAAALTETHAAAIVHRDIKPENIFLTGDWRTNDPLTDDGSGIAKLLDFGLAKSGKERACVITHPGAVLGTPCYMSPEQLLDPHKADGGSDLWSLAVVAYVALTGKLPFPGDSFGAVCVAIHGGRFRRPTAIRPDLPPEVDRWFARALHKKPTARFRKARDFVESFCAIKEISDARVSAGHLQTSYASLRASLAAIRKTLRRSASTPRKRVTFAAAACAGVLCFWMAGPALPAAVLGVRAAAARLSCSGAPDRTLTSSGTRASVHFLGPTAKASAARDAVGADAGAARPPSRREFE